MTSDDPALAAAELTVLLNALGRGEEVAAQSLLPRVADELERIASRVLGGQAAGHTLSSAGLVNEAYLRLFGRDEAAWNDRAHFFALAARAMRQILVDHARRKLAAKRGGGERGLGLTLAAPAAQEVPVDVLDVNAALEELEALDPRQARIVELRYFGELEVSEVADVLDVSKSTVEREWRAARAWLGTRLRESPAE